MKPVMKIAPLLFALAMPAAALVPGTSAFAQGVPGALLADHMVSTYRLHGMMVVSDHNQPWGVIEDVLIPTNGEPMAVVSVGKMVGHAKMVEVPLSHLTVGKDRAMMHGATMKMAQELPPFAYAIITGG